MKYLIALVLLVGCGGDKQAFNCSNVYSDKVLRMVGPNEHAKCEVGEVVLEAYMVSEPGGAPKWLNVSCAKVSTKCE